MHHHISISKWTLILHMLIWRLTSQAKNNTTKKNRKPRNKTSQTHQWRERTARLNKLSSGTRSHNRLILRSILSTHLAWSSTMSPTSTLVWLSLQLPCLWPTQCTSQQSTVCSHKWVRTFRNSSQTSCHSKLWQSFQLTSCIPVRNCIKLRRNLCQTKKLHFCHHT